MLSSNRAMQVYLFSHSHNSIFKIRQDSIGQKFISMLSSNGEMRQCLSGHFENSFLKIRQDPIGQKFISMLSSTRDMQMYVFSIFQNPSLKVRCDAVEDKIYQNAEFEQWYVGMPFQAFEELIFQNLIRSYGIEIYFNGKLEW